MSEWQPIETAPKDYTKILLGSFDRQYDENDDDDWQDYASSITIGFWGWKDNGQDDQEEQWCDWNGGFSYDEDGPDGAGWVTVKKVTHWMPLPKPPSGLDKSVRI